MIVSNDPFLIHKFKFPRNLGQDLKLAEGKQRSGRKAALAAGAFQVQHEYGQHMALLQMNSLYELLAISDTIMFSCFRPWMACDRGLQEINACFYWTC